MTLEEAKIRADNGDTDAMMALAKHYFKDSDNEESYELACMYQEHAAEAGDPNALVQMAQSSQIHANLMLQLLEQVGKNEDIMQALENAYKWASKLLYKLNQLNIRGESEQFAYDTYIDSLFRLSAVYCLDENYIGISRITKDISSPVAQALHGLALFQQSETDTEVNQAFDFLKNAMNTYFWSEKYAETQTLELLRVETVLTLSHLYRIHNDADSAYNVLSTLLRNTNDPKLRTAVQKEMSCYRKALFGGYKYIG